MSRDENWQQTDNDRGPSPFLIGLVAVGVITLVFILQNNDSATVKFLFFDVEVSLWVVIIIAIVLGMALDRLLQMWMRRRKERRRD
ncbi:MAG: LapA family protein [Acidimicrobiia bacterium]|nr:LapA family protein [Acidimicrobiia bacterium]